MSGDRLIRASDLVGPFEIGQMLIEDGDHLDELLALASDFPSPVVCTGESGTDRLWLLGDVIGWAKTNGRPIRIESQPTDVHLDVMTAAEIATELGWTSSSTPWDLVKKGRFPAPIDKIGRQRLWSRSDVEEWDRTAKRYTRRRRSSS